MIKHNVSCFLSIGAKCTLSFVSLKPLNTGFICKKARSVLVCIIHYWRYASLILGEKDRALKAYTKCRPRGPLNLREGFRNHWNVVFFLSCWYFGDILELRFVVAKLFESCGQPRPAKWKITIKLRSGLKMNSEKFSSIPYPLLKLKTLTFPT